MKKLITLLLLTSFAFSACSFLQQPQQKPSENPQQVKQSANQPANEPIETRIRRSIDRFNGEAGLFAKNLQNGKTIAVNENKIFPTASTHKLVVALATYKYLYTNVSADKKRSMMNTSEG